MSLVYIYLDIIVWIADWVWSWLVASSGLVSPHHQESNDEAEADTEDRVAEDDESVIVKTVVSTAQLHDYTDLTCSVHPCKQITSLSSQEDKNSRLLSLV